MAASRAGQRDGSENPYQSQGDDEFKDREAVFWVEHHGGLQTERTILLR